MWENNNADYSELLLDYCSSTNGKSLTASYLRNFCAQKDFSKLLDVGGGNGYIASELSKDFTEVVVIEPNVFLADKIRNLDLLNVKIIQNNIENITLDEKFDIILLSYFLDTIPISKYRCIINKLNGLLSSNGKIVCVTYLDGCDWDVYVRGMSNLLGEVRRGGYNQILSSLKNIDWYPQVIQIFDSALFAQNYDDLHKVVRYFF